MAYESPMEKCCFCIPLKSGVVINSIIWLIYGVYNTVSNYVYYTGSYSGTNLFSYTKFFTLPVAIISFLIAMAAALGLLIVTCKKASILLDIYKFVAYTIATIFILIHIGTLVLYIAYKSTFIDKCTANLSLDQKYQGNPQMDCQNGYNSGLLVAIVTAILVIVISVYFAMVVDAYAKYRHDRARTPTDLLDTA